MINNELPGLYIHIPFCLSKCRYCSFYSVASYELIPEFVKNVAQEMSFYKDSFCSFDTVYLGGGTPSLLSIEQIDKILVAVRKSFEIGRKAEITIEVNPGDTSLECFKALLTEGINRLNIGVQAFDDHILKFLGRRHTVREAVTSLDAARKAGFENIGIDLIYGVHGQDILAWRQTLEKAVSLAPEHLSCYQLSLDPQTPLYHHYRQEGFSLPSEDEALEFFITTSQALTDAGYIHYEVSNFARSDKFKSRHNLKYWRHLPYLGLGPAAHSFKDCNRWWNLVNVDAYVKTVSENRTPVEQTENLSIEQLSLETIFLGLRTQEGISLTQYQDCYGIDLLSDKEQTIDELIKNKLVEIKKGRLVPTLAGMAVADSLALI